MNSFDFMYWDKNLYSICHIPKIILWAVTTLPKVGYAFSWNLTISQDCNWHVMCVLLIRASGLLCCWPKYIKPLVRPPISRLTCRYTNVNMICIPPMGIPNFAKFVVNSWCHRSWSICSLKEFVGWLLCCVKSLRASFTRFGPHLGPPWGALILLKAVPEGFTLHFIAKTVHLSIGKIILFLKSLTW
jgi:hypothetical protein